LIPPLENHVGLFFNASSKAGGQILKIAPAVRNTPTRHPSCNVHVLAENAGSLGHISALRLADGG
jgi:hypothetical protein